MDFTEDQIHRYARHILLDGVGGVGQRKLLESRVLVIGAGGLGSPVLMYLAAAGVGTLGVVDDDVVDLSNLQRQIVHSTEAVGTPKVKSAQKTLAAINPDVTVIPHHERITADNALDMLSGYDVVADGPDNSATRFLVIGEKTCPATGNDRTSILFAVHDRPGSLVAALRAFDAFKINMSKIESRPSKQKDWEYIFYVDLAGHCENEQVSSALRELETH